MQEGVDARLGDIRVSSQIRLCREKRSGVPAFKAAVKQVVERRVHPCGANVRVRSEIMRGTEKD